MLQPVLHQPPTPHGHEAPSQDNMKTKFKKVSGKAWVVILRNGKAMKEASDKPWPAFFAARADAAEYAYTEEQATEVRWTITAAPRRERKKR